MSGAIEDEYTFSPRRTPTEFPTTPSEPQQPTQPTTPTEPTEPQQPTTPTEPQQPRPEPIPLPTWPGAPEIAYVAPRNGQQIEIGFATEVDPTTANESSAYQLQGAEVTGVTQEGGTEFVLETTPLEPNRAYQLNIRGVKTAAGEPLPDIELVFRSPVDVSAAPVPVVPWPRNIYPNIPTGEPTEGADDQGGLGCSAGGGAIALALLSLGVLARRARREKRD
jgi:uncharacterized protein (TIGR03382 family)